MAVHFGDRRFVQVTMNLRPLLAVALVGAALLGGAQAGYAELATTGSGKDRVLDAKQFSGDRAEQYKLFVSRCTKCHDMNRTLVALESGNGPVTGAKFDKEGMKAYVVGLMRKPNSGLTKEEAPKILEFLGYAREQAQKAKETVIPFGPGMERPKKKSGPDPTYTREAREAKVEGKLIAQCVVTKEGDLKDCKVLKSLPFMDRAVLEALAQQKWEPATVGGKPVAVLFTIPFVFKLKA